MPEFRYTRRFEDVYAIRETEKALSVYFGDGVWKWVPKSQIDDDSEVYIQGQEGTIVISDWWAEKEGL